MLFCHIKILTFFCIWENIFLTHFSDQNETKVGGPHETQFWLIYKRLDRWKWMKKIRLFICFWLFVQKLWSLKCHLFFYFLCWCQLKPGKFSTIWYKQAERSRCVVSENVMVCCVSSYGLGDIGFWNFKKTADSAEISTFFYFMRQSFNVSKDNEYLNKGQV